jgi:long-subunit acyl-CoA synthetase (AMP-forming)
VAIGTEIDQLYPLKGIKLRVNSENVLELKGDMIFSAYATTQKEMSNNDWLKTKDKVIWNGHYLSIKGRNDQMIITGGENIAPEWIESLIHPVIEMSSQINDIAIGKIPHKEWGHTIVALINGDVTVFKEWLQQHPIEKKYQPKICLQVKKIPRNSMSKIDRRAVQVIIDQYYH